MDIPQTKAGLRLEMRRKRAQISSLRRQQAADHAALLPTSGLVLSYCSFQDELDTQILNQTLLKSRSLVLPKLTNNQMTLYQVFDLHHLKLHKLGFLEPDPLYCPQVDPSSLSLIFVPGLAFDSQYNRLGYGLGCYDKFLSTLPPFIPTLGLGFKEQLIADMPKDFHDVALTGLRLL